MLDVRFEKSYITGILGSAQWRWLENVLQHSDDDLILIGSGIQFLMNNRLFNAEHWDNRDLQRLLKLMKLNLKTNRIVFLSGDVHHG